MVRHRLRAPLAGAAAVTLLAATATAGAATPRAPRAATLHVAISVPSVLYSNGRQAWVANTGKSSVLELSASSGRELLNVTGSRFHLDNSDAIVQYGNDVWVSNAASDAVTEFYSKSGALKHVLKGPKFHFAIPAAIVVADQHVFVLAQTGDKITEINERTGRLVRYLQGPRYHLVRAVAMVHVGNDVWVASHGGSLTELSAATGGVMRVITASAARLDVPTAIATDGRYLFVANRHGSHLSVLSASTGAFVRVMTSSRLHLDRITSLAIVQGRLWMASTWTHAAFVAGIRVSSGAPVVLSAHAYGYPAVFGDGHHVWVVDRIQSRVSELDGRTGRAIHIISR